MFCTITTRTGADGRPFTTCGARVNPAGFCCERGTPVAIRTGDQEWTAIPMVIVIEARNELAMDRVTRCDDPFHTHTSVQEARDCYRGVCTSCHGTGGDGAEGDCGTCLGDGIGAPAVVNPDGSPTAFTLRMFGR